MKYTDALPILKELPKKYNFTQEENEAFGNMYYICMKKAQEEKTTPECLYYVDKYYFHNWLDAMAAVKRFKTNYIIEKRTDKFGNMTSKKYIINNGKILRTEKL